MKNQKVNCFKFNNWLKKTICMIGFAGISTLISLPILSQEYPPIFLFQPDTDPNYSYRNVRDNLVYMLKNDTNFDNLVSTIEKERLTKTLETEEFTLLAPSDAAFNALADNILEKFSQPGNLNQVLLYHLIPGEVTQQDLDRGEIITLGGNVITFSYSNGQSKLNDANAKFPSKVAINGVIIEIDKVLLPPGF